MCEPFLLNNLYAALILRPLASAQRPFMFTRSPLLTFSQRAKGPWWLFVLLVAILISNSKEARGACGDYLMVKANHGAAALDHFNSSSLAIFQSYMSKSDLNGLTVPVLPSLPCRGPNCGRSPLHEAVPPAVPLSHDTEKLACVEDFNTDSLVRVDFFTDGNPRPILPTPVQEIFHPPRA